MKRLFDLAFAAVGLILLSPLFVIIALWVRVDSRGPVFFRQTRVGRHGAEFVIHKFRTMRTDNAGTLVTVGADPRITRSGRFLRRTKLDELPQLLDVFIGKMSLVGPRPEVPQYVAHWPVDKREVVLSIRPGITDPAAIEFCNESELLSQQDNPERFYVEVLIPRKLDLYVGYVVSRSLLGDLRLVLATLIAVAK